MRILICGSSKQMRNDIYRSANRWALISIVGTIFYVLLDILVQLLPPHYSALREAESLLAVEPYGFIMNLNFLIRGTLSFSIIVAIASIRASMRVSASGEGEAIPSSIPPSEGMQRDAKASLTMTGSPGAGMIFFGLWSAGSFLLGFFNTDTHGAIHFTFHGTIHLLLALVAFVCAPIGEILLSTSFGRAKELSGLCTPALSIGILSALLLLLQFAGSRLGYFGLFERMFIGSVLLWGVVVSFNLIRPRALQA